MASIHIDISSACRYVLSIKVGKLLFDKTFTKCTENEWRIEREQRHAAAVASQTIYPLYILHFTYCEKKRHRNSKKKKCSLRQ